MRLITLHCFFLTLVTVFFICLVPYILICLYYFLIVFLFSPSFSFFSRHEISYNLQCLIRFYYNLPVILRDKKNFTVHYLGKCVALIIINPILQYFRKTKYEFFLPPYQITFILVFDQVSDQKIFSQLVHSHHTSTNILGMNFYNYFVTRRHLIILHTESFH